jgi:N-acetyl-anhydromuramyl-L-alanine amidase AmpD
LLKRILLLSFFLLSLTFGGCIFNEEPMPRISATQSLSHNVHLKTDTRDITSDKIEKNHEWIPLASENKFRWEGIVIHHSGCSYGDKNHIDQTHKARGYDGVGYHFIINNGYFENGYGQDDGTVEVSYRWIQQLTGAHCRVTGDQSNYWNEHTIGICLIGNFENTNPTPKQWQSLVELITFLQQRYNIPINRICGHRDVKPTKCPGTNFSFSQLRLYLTNYKADSTLPMQR